MTVRSRAERRADQSLRRPIAGGLVAVATTLLVACGGSDEPSAVTLITYESFPTEGTPLNEAISAFAEDTGIDVEIVVAGDTGTMVSKAVLTAGDPEGDVMFGVDNTFLSRVVDAEVFEPYEAEGLDAVVPELRELVPRGEATPVDFGDVCINVDLAWFDERGLEPPSDLQALTAPQYRDLLVVQNPATSSPGMAFLMVTVAEFGANGWAEYWAALRDNGVEVVDSWEAAYYERFSGASDGDRPLVVSYGSSPPFEVLFAEPPIEVPTTGAIESTCFRQVEFAGVLAGTDSPEEARRLVDFLISPAFQEHVAINLFVFPVVDVPLDDVFVEHAIVPAEPRSLEPATIDANREAWIEEWTDVVLR